MASTAGAIKGNWSITKKNGSDVFQEGELVTNVQEVFMLRLPVGEALRPGSTTFATAFDADNHEHVFYEAALQLMLKTAADVRASYEHDMHEGTTAASASAIDQGDPFPMFLETVVGTEPDEKITLEFETPEYVNGRPFMRGVTSRYPVVEYRVWFFVRVTGVEADVGKMIADTVHHVNQQFNKRYAAVTVRKKKGGKSSNNTLADEPMRGEAAKKDDESVSMIEYQGDANKGMVDYGQSLKETERWKLIRSKGVWCQVADMIAGMRRLTHPKTYAKVMNYTLGNDANPAHPRYVLSPFLYFAYPNAYADAPQRDVRGYRIGEDWTFPVPDRVVRVSEDDAVLARFRSKLFPDFQIRSYGESLENDMNLPAPRLTAEYMERMSMQQHQRRGSPSLGEADLDRVRDELVNMMLDDEEAGDAAAAAGLGQAQVDEFGNLLPMDPDEEAAAASGMQGQPARAIGGSTPARIKQMIESTLPTDDLEAFDSRALQRENFEDATTLQAQNLLNSTDNPEVSSFHFMIFRGAKLRSEFMGMAQSGRCSREELRRQYLGRQQVLFREYNDSCMSDRSDISTPGKIMNAWYRRRAVSGKTWIGHNTPKVDGTLSIMGNVMIRRSARLESAMFVANAHPIAVTILFGSLDAYRHDLNLHFNMILSGTHATGKSFVMTLLTMLRVPKTVTIEGNATTKSNYVDSYHNDEIKVTHEYRPEFLRNSKKGGDDTLEAEFKEYLTSMVRIIRSFHKDKSGRRTNRIVYSQQIQTHFGCTNIQHQEFSDAIHSRFSCVNFTECYRLDRHPADLINVEKKLTPSGMARRDEFVDEMCAEQFLHFHVEKLIKIGALTEVTLKATDLIRHTFSRRMRDRYLRPVDPRCQERITLLARQLVITRALELLYSVEGKMFWKQPFSVFQLQHLDPLLHDDEEIALLAIDLMRHEMESTTRTLFVKTLYEISVAARRRNMLSDQSIVDPGDSLRQLFLTPDTQIVSSGGMFVQRRLSSSTSSLSSSSSSSSSGEPPRSLGPHGRLTSSSTHLRSNSGFFSNNVSASDMYPASHMYAYFRVPGGVQSVVSRVAAATKNSAVVLSEDQAKSDLNALRTMNIHARPYKWDPETNQPVPASDEEDVTSGEPVPAAIITPQDVFIHLDLVAVKDDIEESIKFCQCAFDGGRTRRYVSGVVLSTQKPYLWRVRELVPGQGRPHKVTDYAREVTNVMEAAFPDIDHTDGTGTSVQGPQLLSDHYDALSRRERAEALFLNVAADGAADGVCAVEPYEEHAANHYTQRGISLPYPECMDSAAGAAARQKRAAQAEPAPRQRSLAPPKRTK